MTQLTEQFNECSQQVITLERALAGPLGQPDAAELLREVQQQEREKLRLTLSLQVSSHVGGCGTAQKHWHRLMGLQLPAAHTLPCFGEMACPLACIPPPGAGRACELARYLRPAPAGAQGSIRPPALQLAAERGWRGCGLARPHLWCRLQPPRGRAHPGCLREA